MTVNRSSRLQVAAAALLFAAAAAQSPQAQTAAAGLPATAEATAAGAAASAAAATTLEPVVVSGSISARRAADAPYSISVVDADALKAGGPMVNLSESLSRVPGLTVANRNNYAQDLQISSRGFGARAGFGVRGLRLLTDGIPATMPDGQGQVTHFDIAGAQRIEVLRGPFSALYGNSSGGVIALFTAAAGERRIGLDGDAASLGLRQGRFSIAAPLDNGFDLKAQYSALNVDGFRPHAGAERRLGNLRLGWRGIRDRVVLLAGDITQKAQDPLGLSRAQLDADPDQTTPQATQFDTRKTARQTQVGARWEHAFDDAGALSDSALTAYRGSRSVSQWLAIAAATQAPVRHGGGVVDFDRRYDGVDARLTWRRGRVELVTGVAVETAKDDRRGYENFTGAGDAQQLGVTGRLRRDEVNRVTTRDLFAQAEAALTRGVSATLGVRSGRVDFEADDRYLSNGDDSGRLRFDYTTPVLGLRWKPAPAWTLHASAARGFESPTLGELAYQLNGAAGFNTALAPQRSRQAEVGARWTGSGSRTDTGVQAALFRIDTRDEIGVSSNAGGRQAFQNVGRTRRDGAELGVQAAVLPSLVPSLKGQMALTWLDAKYRDAFLTCAGTPCTTPDAAVSAGKRIAGTSGRSIYAELAWQAWHDLPATVLAVEWRAQGRTPVNDQNGDFAGGFGETALRLSHRIVLGSNAGAVELLARVDNLGDRCHVGSVIVNDGNGRYFEPAAPRSGLISVRYSAGW